MTVIDDIATARDEVVSGLRECLLEVITKKQNASAAEKPRWQAAEDELKNAINTVNALAFQRALDEADAALTALKQLNTDLATAAKRMQTATAFLNALAKVLEVITTAAGAMNKD